MAWNLLTIIDANERRDAHVQGTNWMFHTCTTNPSTVRAFSWAEMEYGNHTYFRYSLTEAEDARFRHIREAVSGRLLADLVGVEDELVLRVRNMGGRSTPLVRATELYSIRRAPVLPGPTEPLGDGRVIIDLREKTIEVRAYPAEDGLDWTEERDGHHFDPETGELLYEHFDFLSMLREGEAGYKMQLDSQLLPRSFLQDETHLVISEPDEPRKDNPYVLWSVNMNKMKTPNDDPVPCEKIAHWETPYRLSDEWKIIDGHNGKEY